MSGSVRPITPNDLPVLAALHARCFAEPWDEKALADLIAAPGSIALITEAAGFILIRVVADEAEILSIGVAPDRRREGLAASLLEIVSAKASEMGAHHMFLEVVTHNLPAKSLYESYGFRPVGHRKAYYQGQDALVLKAALPLVGKLGKTL